MRHRPSTARSQAPSPPAMRVSTIPSSRTPRWPGFAPASAPTSQRKPAQNAPHAHPPLRLGRLGRPCRPAGRRPLRLQSSTASARRLRRLHSGRARDRARAGAPTGSRRPVHNAADRTDHRPLVDARPNARRTEDMAAQAAAGFDHPESVLRRNHHRPSVAHAARPTAWRTAADAGTDQRRTQPVAPPTQPSSERYCVVAHPAISSRPCNSPRRGARSRRRSFPTISAFLPHKPRSRTGELPSTTSRKPSRLP